MHMSALASQLEQKTRQLAETFRPDYLQRDYTCFQFVFDDGEPFHLLVHGGEFTFRVGIHWKPTLNLYLDAHSTCWDLLEGRGNSMQAFMKGDYRADGNIVLSQLLLYLFNSNDRPRTHED
jgi:putative sterol carrier protein